MYVKKVINNYPQARCMMKMEERVIKTGRTEEFNKQF
jgi:hypothetical protein